MHRAYAEEDELPNGNNASSDGGLFRPSSTPSSKLFLEDPHPRVRGGRGVGGARKFNSFLVSPNSQLANKRASNARFC